MEKVLILLILLTPYNHFGDCKAITVFQWPNGKVQVAWPNSTWFRQHGGKSVSVIGIKIWADKIYVTVPRWYGNSHPLNLAVLDRPKTDDELPNTGALRPFPDWEMQRLGDCNAFQYVQSMEVERSGVMWLPDMGRQLKKSSTRSSCPAKIILLDLKMKTIISKHNFPESVVPKQSSFLNDITLNVANEDDKYAYISDSERGVLVVYSLARNSSWLVRHSSMRADLRGATFNFINPPARLRIDDNNINGVAVSSACSGSQYLFYSPLTSLNLFKIKTSALNENKEDVNDDVTVVGTKSSQTDGIASDNQGNLYMQEITGNALDMWNTRKSWNPRRLVQDNETLIWADTLAIDDQGYLWTTSRGWPIDIQPRIVKSFVGDVKPFDYC